jgi:hypothetical protein
VEEPGLAGPGDQDVGEPRQEVRAAHRALGRLAVLGQGVVPPHREARREEFELIRGGGETLVPVLPVPHLAPHAVVLLELLPRQAHGLEDVVQPAFEGVPPVLPLPHAMGEVVQHLVVRPALADLHDLPAGQKPAVALPEVTDVVHLEPGGGRKHDIGELGRGRDEEVGHGHEVHLLERSPDLSGIRPGKEGVR